jgi:hypothetical protein
MQYFYSLSYHPSRDRQGGGFPNGDGFIGLQFQINGQDHFGWVGFQIRQTYYLGVWGYAYETVPNKPIVTGQTYTPEPGSGSLVALALGSLGLGLWRRRKAGTSE